MADCRLITDHRRAILRRLAVKLSWPAKIRSADRAIGSQHIAEQSPLLDGVVERHMGMRDRIEPFRGHRPLPAHAVRLAHQRHRIGLDIDRRIAEGFSPTNSVRYQ